MSISSPLSAVPLVPSSVLLEAKQLSRSFGGLWANQNIDLRLYEGQIHALLGPNGAGKSTCINLLSGDLLPSSGQILLYSANGTSQDMTHLSAAQRSQKGLGRSYQRSNLFPQFTVFENCRLAAQSRCQRPWHFLSQANRYADYRAMSDQAIQQMGLQSRADRLAASLSYGEQRQLEIAMVLATQAKILLLDEPLAGMGHDEALQMVALLNQLKKAHAILLVEHDMEAVFAVADIITVLVNGQVLASGLPQEIRQNPQVQTAYLGESEAESMAGGGIHG